MILSGTATDGTAGLQAIKAEGGITFAQDESARYDSMPRSAVAAACVDFVLPPDAIAGELARVAKHPAVVRAGLRDGSPEAPGASGPAAPSVEQGVQERPCAAPRPLGRRLLAVQGQHDRPPHHPSDGARPA